MKLLKTIKKIIKESEERYIYACECGTPIDELDRLEKNYKESLKLLKLFNSNKNKSKDN